MKLKNKKYKKISCRKRIREPKRCPGLDNIINKSKIHMDFCAGILRRIFLIKTGILIDKYSRVQRSQPNPITKNYIKSLNRKSRHQKLKDKYEQI